MRIPLEPPPRSEFTDRMAGGDAEIMQAIRWYCRKSSASSGRAVFGISDRCGPGAVFTAGRAGRGSGVEGGSGWSRWRRGTLPYTGVRGVLHVWDRPIVCP